MYTKSSYNAKLLFDYSQKLLEKFRYPWEMMPLMYVILKDAKADIEEALRRIDEATRVFGEFTIQLRYPTHLYYNYYTAAAAAAASANIPVHLGTTSILPFHVNTLIRPPTPNPPLRPGPSSSLAGIST